MAKVVCRQCGHPPFIFPLDNRGICKVCSTIEGLKMENKKLEALLGDTNKHPLVLEAERIIKERGK